MCGPSSAVRKAMTDEAFMDESLTDESTGDVKDETTLLVNRIRNYVRYTWKGMANALSGLGFEVSEAKIRNVGYGRVIASPQLKDRILSLARQVGVKEVLEEDDTADVLPVVDLAMPMLSMGIGREAYEQTQRDYSGYYIGIRANEQQGYVCAWTKLLALREAVGVPRFNTWRPDESDGCIVSTGYYFSSTKFLYMVSHPINDVSIRYSALRRGSRDGLVGITTGVSSTSVILSTNIYLKRIAGIGEEGISRMLFVDRLGEFSSREVRERFPEEAEAILAQTSMIKPSGD